MVKKITQLKNAMKTYGDVKKVYLQKYALLSEIRDDLKKGKYELKDIVNFLYVFREISKLADDMRKEADGLVRMFENVCCAIYVTQHQNDPEKADPIRASLATGTPRIKLGVNVPSQKTEPEKYYKLMQHFGVPKEALENKVVKAYWPGLCETISQLAEEGKPLPPGIDADKTYPTYTVSVLSVQSLDEMLRKLKGRRASTCERLLTTR